MKKRGRPVGSGKPKEKAPDVPKPRGGRAVGSVNFGADEMAMLVEIVEQHLPIGGHGWDEVLREYNAWAKKEGFRERDQRSLKQKFDKVRGPLYFSYSQPCLSFKHRLSSLP